MDNYDTLITKAALHGAKLLKKPHQALAVNLASHLWWQEAQREEEAAQGEKETEKTPVKQEEGEEPEAEKAVWTFILCHICGRLN